MAQQAKIAYYGEEGSFSHVAARQRFGPRAAVACPTMDEAFAKLKARTVSQIVVPIENTSVGIISDTVDQLMALALKPGKGQWAIRECLVMPVAFALLAQNPHADKIGEGFLVGACLSTYL